MKKLSKENLIEVESGFFQWYLLARSLQKRARRKAVCLNVGRNTLLLLIIVSLAAVT